MTSLGSSSKWPSYDSLPSTPSLLHSESEQTEDEADVFSEGEGDGAASKSFSGDGGRRLSRRYIDFPSRSVGLYAASENDGSQVCQVTMRHANPASTPGAMVIESSSTTPGDLLFAQKCAELQRFICPLLELLRGLQAGRFEKGLTSFQQSVAMDRLQRILGILQKPEMGERYLHNLLQIEVMLKLWFPQVALKSVTLTQNITPRLVSNWHQNQLHIPVKKRKLSWSDPVHSGETHHDDGNHSSCGATTSLDVVFQPTVVKKQRGSCQLRGQECAEHAGKLSRPAYSCKKEAQCADVCCPPSPHGSPATQDNSVSSSDATTTADSP